MVTSNRFYPKGTVGTETAILWLARERYPDRWRDDAMTKEEKSVWSGINKTFSGFVISNILPYSVPKFAQSAALERFCDFSEAFMDLRRALQADEIRAYFIDENGKEDFIKPYSWGIDAAEEVLLTGLADLDDGWTRLVLINEAALHKLFRQKAAKERVDKSTLPLPPSLAALNDWYRVRISDFQSSGKVPTIAQDEEAAKAKFPGITRSMVRDCRQSMAPPEWAKRGPREKLNPKPL